MASRIASRDEGKMIILHVGFWTNNLPAEEDDGKTAWMKGTIYLRKNKSRGITPKDVKFNGEGQFLSKMQALLHTRGIRLLDIDEPHDQINLSDL